MNILESVDKYIRERWQDIIELIETENDVEIKIKYPNEQFSSQSNFKKESVFNDDGEKILDLYFLSKNGDFSSNLKKRLEKLKVIIKKDIKISANVKKAGGKLNFNKSNELFEDLEFLSLLPETNPNMVLIVECNGNIIYSNKSTHQWLEKNGFSKEEDIKVLYPKSFKNKFCSSCGHFDLKSEKVDYKGQTFDFKIKPLLPNEKCMIILTDITEIERLSKEKELYYKAFQSSIHAMLITDTKGNIKYVNPKFLDLYGYEYSEVIGKNPNILNPGKDKYYDLGYPKQKYHELFRGLWMSISDPKKGYWEGTIPNQKKNGDIVWVNLIISAVHDSSGEITNYLGMPVDITERRKENLKIR
ncbi:PAS domain-containing protein [Geotoga petraea]|uniref:PAS domain S-box protein n=1 Tax=Geotoga petraea TaxID=28234 RepID=A0A4Z0W622_9BACT|nr:PAS domain S-box protein [Geotoga petraea]TGG89286.1 PAS domain S-box protein [Geotoga petraea]